jgi:hypothetical protein
VLDAIASIGSKLSLIVFPVYSENNDLIRLGESFEYFMRFIDRVFSDEGDDIGSHLIDCLKKFGLSRIPSLKPVHKIV